MSDAVPVHDGGRGLRMAATMPALASDNSQKNQGVVELSNCTKVPQADNLAKPDLTNEQRETIVEVFPEPKPVI
jgi:hypothetical protein